jgi:hypothetical protein
MKAWTLILGLAACAASFPSADNLHHMGMHNHRKIDKRCPMAEMQAEFQRQIKEKQHDKRFLFDTMDKPIDSVYSHQILCLAIFANSGSNRRAFIPAAGL